MGNRAPPTPPTEPLIRRIPVCRETKTGKVDPYRYMTKCGKGGEPLTELNAWEAKKWEYDAESKSYREKRILLCDRCAKRAIAHYRKS